MNDSYLDGRHVIGKHAIMGTDGLRSFGMVGQATIHKMTELLKEAARPTRIVLFGSHARGDTDPGSDLDVLVVEKDVADRGAEIVRLNRVLSPLRVPVDLLVVREDVFQYWCDTPGNVYFEAATQGQVLYDAA